MSQNFIDIFKSACVKLAGSVVINHPYAGAAINARLKQEGLGNYTNSQNRNTWKYYQNMAGIYHPTDLLAIAKINKKVGLGTSAGINSGKMIIRVASNPDINNGFSSTVEKEFTIDTISSVGADESLALEYQPGEQRYEDLLSVYPEFESLIRGILHPIPLLVSATSDDFTVLYCGGYYRTRLDTLQSEYAFIKGVGSVYNSLTLAEDWELSLIPAIDAFTKIYFRQYDNRVYAEYNDLYLAANIGIYYLNLPMMIFNHRMEKIKTLETHSTHVQLYLDSFSYLGQYISYFTREQYMFLYRNMEWLAANTGKQKVFDVLVSEFLKHAGIAVIVYDGYHDSGQLTNVGDNASIFIRRYDDVQKLIDSKSRYTPTEIVALELQVAKDNGQYIEDQNARVNQLSLNSTSSLFKTKIIETHLSNQTAVQYVSKEEFFFNNWVWSAVNNEYSGIMSVTLPNTGNTIQLTVKNALLLFYYCYGRGYLDTHPTEIPTLLLHHIPKTISEAGSVDSLKPLRSDPLFTDAELNKLYNHTQASRFYPSTAAFGKEMRLRWNEFVDRNYVAHANPHIRASAEIKAMVEKFYLIEKLDISLGTDYDSWVSSLGNGLISLSTESYQLLADDLFKVALDITDQDKDSLTKMHLALISVVKTFSSYNIQFITKTAAGEVSNLGVNYLRAEHVSTNSLGSTDYHILNYPDYQTESPHSSQTSDRYGFDTVYDSYSDTILLSQEQLRGLVLTENNSGITVGV